MSIDQELASDGDQDDLGRLASIGHTLDEVGQARVEPFRTERAHEQRAAKLFHPDFAHPSRPAHRASGAVLLWRQADKGRECLGRKVRDVGQLSKQDASGDLAKSCDAAQQGQVLPKCRVALDEAQRCLGNFSNLIIQPGKMGFRAIQF